ncbi:MAG: galactose mutarotase [Lachnospiraceae bacterium]|nr:galactose mutarotase [Lachnospiraceae bacterium]
MVNYTHKGEVDGRDVIFYRISDGGAEAVISNLGATLVALFVKNGEKMTDVVLGFDTPEEYLKEDVYLGTVVGRCCNRIGGAAFELGGETYHLEANDGRNNLHSGFSPYKKRIYDANIEGENSVSFSLLSPDGDQGFPGTLNFKVTYTMTGDTLRIDYEGKSDKDTIFNPTNHSYFNLSGHESGARGAMSQSLRLSASFATPNGEGTVPNGEKRSVEGPFDFREFHAIGERIECDDEQLRGASGYDHNFLIDGPEGEFRYAATLRSCDGSIEMDVYTDCPGVQLYSSNYLGDMTGKGGAKYERRGAVCLETQYVPNAINMTGFKVPIAKAGETVKSRTEYRFRTCGK